MADVIGTWLQAIFTIILISGVFQDNRAYRLTEHIYVGLFAGYNVVITWANYIQPSISIRLIGEHKWSYIVPIILGLLIYTRYSRSVAWLSRYSIAFTMGISAGYILSKDFKPFLVDQMKATFTQLWGTGNWFTTVSNWLFMIGTICTLLYFVFTVEKRGVPGKVAAVGRWTMMIAFGAAFGNTVMGRVALFVGRMQFLLRDWLKIIT